MFGIAEAEDGGFLDGSAGKGSACNTGDVGSIPGSEKSPGERMKTHFSIVAQKILGTEEPGGVQSVGSQTGLR